MNHLENNIRIATHIDLHTIDEIYNIAISASQTAHTIPLSLEQREDWFQHHNRNYPVFVYELNNTVTGWLSFSPYREGRQALQSTAEISFYLFSEYQGKGIGSVLVNFALSQAAALGFKNLFAIILESNNASIRLMDKCGFKQWGFLPRIAELNGKKLGHVFYGINLE